MMAQRIRRPNTLRPALPACLLAVCIAAASCPAQPELDRARLLKSALLPGMGQLADGQKIKGLCFMTAQCALLGGAIGFNSRASAHARETEYLKVEYDLADSYDEKVLLKDEWEQSEDDTHSLRVAGVVLSGLAIACWGLNLLDAALLPAGKERTPRRVHTDMRLLRGGAGVCCRLDLGRPRDNTPTTLEVEL